jgi:hypothetical protein
MKSATLLKHTITRVFSDSRDCKIHQNSSFSDDKTARCNQSKNEEGYQTAATKAAMGEAKVAD